MTDSERRTESRMEAEATVFVEICAADVDQSEAADIQICHSLDISANGMQLEMDYPAPTGSILRLCADPGEGEPIYLVGEVMWTKPCEHGYAVGFSLFESENSDIIAWKRLIADKLSHPAAN